MLRRFPFLAVACLLAFTAAAQQPPDPADDPLPEGAKARFGVSRPLLRANPSVALLPPTYTNFLAPTMSGLFRRYDLATHRPLQKTVDLVGPGAVAISADGKRAAVSRPGLLTVVDVATRRLSMAVQPPTGVVISGVTGASFSADGKLLAYGGRGKDGKGEVVVWDVDQDEMIARLETAQAAPVFPTLSADGKILVTHGPPAAAPRLSPPAPGDPMPAPPPAVDADMLRTAQVWDVALGKELFRAHVTGMGGMVVSSALTKDGEHLAISAGDGPIDVWDVKTGKRERTLLGRKGQGVRVAFAPDGRTVASVGPDYRIQRWAADGTPLGVTDAPPGILVAPVTGLAFADNERAIAWLTAAQYCVAWEAPSGRLLSPPTDHQAAIKSIAFAPGNKDLFSSGVDGRVFRWDLPTGQLNEMVTLHPAHLPGQPRLRPIVTLSADATFASTGRIPSEVFDVATGADLYVVPPPSTAPTAVTVLTSPDATKLITVSRQTGPMRSGSCVVWDLATQQRDFELDIPTSSTPTPPVAAINPANTRVVVMTATRNPGGQETLLITGYDLKSGKKLGEVQDPTALGTMYMAAVGDASAVISTTNGRIWSVDYIVGKVGEEIDKLPARGEAATYTAVAVSPDGTRLATGIMGEEPETYGVRVYDWPRGKILHTFIGHVGPVNALRFGPDGKSLATGAQDTSVLLWDLTKIKDEK